jgi:hypothetical protein
MKRRLAKLLVFLLLGAIVNVAVAWGCAAWSRYSPEDYIRSIDQVPDGFVDAVPSEWLDAPPMWPGGRNAVDIRVRVRDALGWSCTRIELWWMQPAIWQAVPDYSVYRVEAGWPASSATCDGSLVVRDSPRAFWKAKWQCGIDPPVWLSVGSMGPLGDEQFRRPLPLKPIWPGFALNTIFYAAVLWFIFAIPGGVKRLRRRRRGSCIHCGYDLRGHRIPGAGAAPEAGHSTKCPECGGVIAR